MTTEFKLCYNKGCNKKYDPASNNDDACCYHPGGPIFHDAKKKWSCCSKYSTDFSEFMNFPGCMTGMHNPNKPELPAKKEMSPEKEKCVVESTPTPQPKPTPMERPSVDGVMMPLPVVIAPSLKSQLEKLRLNETSSESAQEFSEVAVAYGTTCKNGGCKKSYSGPESNNEVCKYHPGVPIFHEGMKYWSCCKKRTPDFDAFMEQVGCNSGNHKWIAPKKSDCGDSVCRHDWHQTANNVCLSVFAKLSSPEESRVTCNGVVLSVDIIFDKGSKQFSKVFNLHGIVDPVNSKVNFMGTKVEINMKKAEFSTWPNLESKST